MLEILEKTHRR